LAWQSRCPAGIPARDPIAGPPLSTYDRGKRAEQAPRREESEPLCPSGNLLEEHRLFSARQHSTILQAAGRTLGLIYHQAVYDLRHDDRNASAGLLMTILQSLLFIAGFLLIFLVIGVRNSPLRGDFMLYIMSGIFMFMTHVRAVGAVAGSAGMGGIMKHEPLNPAVLIISASLATLYRQTISMLAILCFYHMAITPIEIENPVGAAAMFLLAWFSGCSIGLILRGIKPWLPKLVGLLTMFYQRVNMFASGKMFVANALPGVILPWFLWNPLFHVIDQQRGFLFINYTPMKTSPLYALWFSLAALMIGLLINFTTRRYQSLSWGATQ
jgi:ABC-type polysaccharide/polyol phosphate export permease